MGVRVNALGRTVPRRLNMGLGPYPEVSLAEAREKSCEGRKQIRDGINPLEEKPAYKKMTFAECAEEVIKIKAKELKNILLSGALRWKPILIHLLVKNPLAN